MVSTLINSVYISVYLCVHDTLCDSYATDTM